ncbi:MAG TPA: hypothetical protein VFU00_00575 [Gemmatimonadales bacterium]|nr:hypothetical protein [Gemmatimonadales bacterium]
MTTQTRTGTSLMRAPRLSDERGIALAMAVFALVIIGVLVAGAFFAGRLEQRGGANSVLAAQAFEAAEGGLTYTINDDWQTATFNGLAIGVDAVRPAVTIGPSTQAVSTVTRLNNGVFLVRSEGQRLAAGNVLARRVVGSIVRAVIPDIEIEGALTVYGELTLGGSADIDGEDHVPGGWGGSCGGTTDPVAGIRINQDDIHTQGSNCSGDPPACVSGDPQVQVDSTLAPTDFTQFGDLTFDDLAAAANLVVSGTVTNIHPDSLAAPLGSPVGTPGRCNRASSLNWGEPGYLGTILVPPCYEYFPIVYAPGDVHLSGGRGQGILLVRGNLTLSGGVEFFGPVIVLGEVRSTGTGGHVYGGLMARQANFDPSVITGNSVVNYSACAVTRALLGAAAVKPINERGWAQLF